MPLLPSAAPRLGLGCQRLTAPGGPPEAEAIRVIHAALDAGVRLLDTAGVYGATHVQRGANERLIGRALARWSGDAGEVVVATKAGMTRPGAGRWVPDGRAGRLRAACRDSLSALGLERIGLLQLHAPDPRVPLATSVRALRRLQRDGVVERIGLCNVRVFEIEAARALAQIATVQAELSPFASETLRGGVAERCALLGIPLLAYRPLGGPDRRRRLERHPALCAVAQRRGVTPAEVALAWLLGLSPVLVPLPGATRVDSVLSSVRATRLELAPEDVAELDAAFPAGRLLRVPRTERAPGPGTADGEVVLVMGLPGAGKSTAAGGFVARGYLRLNRDQRGGRLRDLLPPLEQALARGERRVVLDNTYASRSTRSDVVETAWRHGVPVRCIWLDTSLEQAQVNVTRRMIRRYGRLLQPDELGEAARSDPGALAPDALFRCRRQLEEPALDEGFAALERVDFAAALPAGYDGKAALMEYDGVLRRVRGGGPYPRSPDDVELLPGARDRLERLRDQGFLLLGVSHQPAIERGELSEQLVRDCFERTHELLGIELDVAYCPHESGPPRCWCRRPLPGLGVWFVEKRRLDPALCIVLGTTPAERGFAARNGFAFRDTGRAG